MKWVKWRMQRKVILSYCVNGLESKKTSKDLELELNFSISWMSVHRQRKLGRAFVGHSFGLPSMPMGALSHNWSMTTSLLQFICPWCAEFAHGSCGKVSFWLFVSSGRTLNRRKHLFGESAMCPSRSFSGLNALDMAKKHPHITQCVLPFFKLTHENGPVSPPPAPPLQRSVFTEKTNAGGTRPAAPLMVIEAQCLSFA